jgi:hypothetical protein
VDVVRQVLSAIETGGDEVLAADMTRQVKAGLSDSEGILAQLRSGAGRCGSDGRFEIIHPVEIGNESGPGWAPSEPLLR